MSKSSFDIIHLAKLANLSLTKEEKQTFSEQLQDIIKYIDQLNTVDTSNVEPTYNITGLKNVFREDIVKPSLTSQKALENALNVRDDYFIYSSSVTETNQKEIDFDGKLDEFNATNAKNTSIGIPVAYKAVFSTEGIETNASSKILQGYSPPYSATVVKMLEAHGISAISKSNCDEFAMGSSGENSAYGATKNPWDLTKVPGGSSSGSAAAVAANLCVFAMGTDTGGSIRMPASLCGVVGLKPSYGRISRYGIIPMASSLDCPGPITKTVGDARQVLEWISGEDGYDSNCQPKFKLEFKIEDLKGIKIGVPKEYFGEGLDKNVEDEVCRAIEKMEELGAEVVEVELPNTKYGIAAYYLIMSSEASSNLARFDGLRYGFNRSKFGPEVKRRIILGTFALSSGYYDDYYQKAAKIRTLIKQDFDLAFEQCDVIVGPVSPTVAWDLGEKINDPLTMYLSDIYTVPASLAGLPAISIPCGFVNQDNNKKLPVGLQIIGKYMDEETILNVGEIYEKNTEWHKMKPQL